MKTFVQKEMNEHDRKLVARAKELSYVDWNYINENEAETEIGYQVLRGMAISGKRREEAIHGEL